ncbi:MAG: hypothetical protein PUE60_07270 [Eubacteriales bacterium]|nr:hypothetical protein [Eubacteriales bacterium]
MAKTIPMIITNKNILVKDKESDEFKTFNMPALSDIPNIPFYHQFAEKIAECQYYFKEFMKTLYGKKLSKYIFAIIVPDDTSRLESIFINEFFVNSGTCKAVAQMPMALALSKEDNKYVSISKSNRNIILEYVRNHESVVIKYYDATTSDPKIITEDAQRLHIDLEYEKVPIYINNFNMNMDEYFNFENIISPKQFMEKIAEIDVEKL